MLSHQICWILSFFDMFGYNSGSSKIFQSQKSMQFICFLHILLATLITFEQMLFYYEFYFLFGLFETMNDLVEIIAALFTCYLIILDANINRRSHKYFWTVLQRIDYNFVPFNFSFKCYIMRIVAFIALVTLTIVMRYTSYNALKPLSFLIVIKICQIRILYYLFCLEVIHIQWTRIEQEFVKLNVNSFNSIPTMLPQKLKQIRLGFHCIYEMMNALNELFGWSQVAGISFSFFCLFAELNYIVIHFNKLSILRNFGKYIFLEISTSFETFQLIDNIRFHIIFI